MLIQCEWKEIGKAKERLRALYAREHRWKMVIGS